MREFDLFRVSGWLDEDGLQRRFEVAVEKIMTTFKAAAGASAICAGALITVSAHSTEVAWPWNQAAQQEALQRELPQARVERLDAAMAHSINRFMSIDQSDLDPLLVDAAADLLTVLQMPIRAR